MNNTKRIGTVFSFEFRSVLRTKAFKLTTIIFAILLLAGCFVPPIISGFSDTDEHISDVSVPGVPGAAPIGTISVTDVDGSIGDPALLAQCFAEYELRFLPDLTAEDACNAVNRDEFAASLFAKGGAYTLYCDTSGLISSVQYSVPEYLGKYQQMYFMSSAGLSDAQIISAMTPPEISVVSSGGKNSENTYLLTYVMIMLLYISVIMYGQIVAMSVTTEKSSRAMELLITSASPNELIFGKIIGVGLSGLIQLSVWILTAVLGISLNYGYWSRVPFVSGLLGAPVSLIFVFIIFFVIGFFIFSAVYGALGSLISRIEDLNTTATPVMLIYVLGFFIAITGMMSPESTLLKICSFIPFFSPMCMFVRISMSTVPIFEIIISVVLMLAFAVLTGIFAAKVYRTGMLMYGQAPKLKELFKIIKNSKGTTR